MHPTASFLLETASFLRGLSGGEAKKPKAKAFIAAEDVKRYYCFGERPRCVALFFVWFGFHHGELEEGTSFADQ